MTCSLCGSLIDLDHDILPDLDQLPAGTDPNTVCIECCVFGGHVEAVLVGNTDD
jgi:hypothetical protein